jgi:putative phosphoesterase
VVAVEQIADGHGRECTKSTGQDVGVTRIVVLADTHVRPGSSRRLPDGVYDHLADADVVLHAGDLVTADVLHELEGFAPVHAVLGNNDHDLLGVLPERWEAEVDGVRFALVHDAGDRRGRAERMRRWFPDAHVVVFGHSHLPYDADGAGGQRLFNPGSATWKRQAPTHTIGLFEVRSGTVVSRSIVDV